MHVQLDTQFGVVTIVNEPTYTFGSQDNIRAYPLELRLGNDYPSSVHGIELNGCRVAVVGASGGCSTVYAHSAVAINDKLYLAIGNHVACLSLSSAHPLVWSTRVDIATCFGIYWESDRAALISHGELAIARLSLQGNVMWSASGADIFTESVRLLPDCIEVTDFNHDVYRFDYATGASHMR
ncbi:hypothetical protein [Burkholderia sp. F1]|uniref:hypothetical protein n=1 Tax=Burkholderia sp. F1 TaxID=3366817 RepID=UPI003D7073A5